MPKSFWMLRCSSPFGIIDINDDSKIASEILELHPDVRPVQTDSYNCGVIWCLLVYDMMLQVKNLFHDIILPFSRELPRKLGIGKTWLDPRLYKKVIKGESILNMQGGDHYMAVCWHFWNEFITLAEQLHILHLQNFIYDLNIPPHLGKFTKVLNKNLINQ